MKVSLWRYTEKKGTREGDESKAVEWELVIQNGRIIITTEEKKTYVVQESEE